MPFNREVFIRLWNDRSVSITKIAKAMGVTNQTVSYHAKRIGLESREKGKGLQHDPRLLAEMYQANVRLKDIAAHFGLAYTSCVTTAARKAGFPPRKRGGNPGCMNGGWPKGISASEFWEVRLADRMAVTVRAEQAEIAKAKLAGRKRAQVAA